MVGWLLFLAGALVFGVLMVNVLTDGPLIQADEPAIEGLHDVAVHGPPAMITLMKVGSGIGYYGIMIVGLGLVILYTARHAWRELSLVLAGVIGGEALFDMVAGTINRPRPHFPNPFEGLTAASFPSGHTVSSTLLFGLLLYLYVPRLSRTIWRVLLIVLGVLLVLWISFSRLYLGSHYPTDVIGGLAMGVAWGSLVYTSLDLYWARRQREARGESPGAGQSHAEGS